MTGKNIKLYVHAGTGKTGTTAIQSYLKRNKKELESQGFLYIGMFFEELDDQRCNVSPLTLFNRALGQTEKQLEQHIIGKIVNAINYCESHNLSNIIWSNESILDRRKSLGPILQKLSEITKQKIILYFRRQDYWFVSAYKQWGIKHKTYNGSVMNFEEWYGKHKHMGYYYDRYKDLEGFVEKDSIELRIYEKCPNVIEDFCQLIGIDCKLSDKMKREYESPSNISLSLFKIYNSQFNEPKLPNDLQPILTSSNISQRVFKKVSPDIDLPTNERTKQILEEYQEQNDKLKTLSKDDYQLEFPDVQSVTSFSKEVDYSEITAALLFALVNVDKRLRNAYKRIDELEKILQKSTADR